METDFSTVVPEKWREMRGREIALKARARIRRCGQRWSVPSATGDAGGYLVDPVEGKCTCPDAELRGAKCKHQHAVEYLLIWEQTEAPDGTVTETVVMRRKTYAQNWPAYNAAQEHEQEHVERFLRALCEGIVEPPANKMGRPRKPLRDKVFAAVHKVYSLCSGRRAQSPLRACEARGLVGDAVSTGTVFTTLEDPALTPLLKTLIEESAIPLRAVEEGMDQFTIDSTGFGTTTYRRWFDHKWGGERSKQLWVKLHAFIGTRTHAITAAEVSDSGDAPMLAPLLAATAKNFNVKEVSADKAYLSHANIRAVHSVGATPYIPFKENSTGAGPVLWRQMYAHFIYRRPDFLAHYHRRSNSETVFAMMKATLGSSVRAKLPIAQANEVLAKCLVHNLRCLVYAIYESGIKPEFWQSQGMVQ